MNNAVKAVILGHAIGDALGVPVEFCERAELDENPVFDMEGFGTYQVPAGAWSDDTSMSLAALDSLADGKVDLTEIMSNFASWILHNEFTPTGKAFDVGGTCLNAILDFAADPSLSPTEYGGKGERSNGNGSLMRIHPFVLYAYLSKMSAEDCIDLVHSASAVTHAHERSKIGCGIYAFALLALLDSPSKLSLLRGLAYAKEYYKNSAELDCYKRIFQKDFESTPRKKIKSSGYVVDTLEAAVWCLLSTSDYESAVLKAVNLGNDTDTVAAVTGGLAGALYGYDSIPQKWLDSLLRRDYIEALCDKLSFAVGENHKP